MRRLHFGALATALTLGAGMLVVSGPAPQSSAEARVFENPRTAQTNNQAPAERQQQTAAIREVDSRLYLRQARHLTAHKNRRPGERAHRRWRFRKASGRA